MADVDRTQIRELLSQGLAAEEVAARLEVSPNTVSAIKAHMTMGTYEGGASRRTAGGIYLRRGDDLLHDRSFTAGAYHAARALPFAEET